MSDQREQPQRQHPHQPQPWPPSSQGWPPSQPVNPSPPFQQPPSQQPPYGQPQWMPQPSQWASPPQQYQPLPPNYPPMQSPSKQRRKAGCIVATIVGTILILSAIANATFRSAPTPAPTNTPAATSAATMPATTSQPTPTPQPIHYPPTTQADLRGLAAKGDANAIHEFHSESVGLTGVCPQPKREVTVNPSVTGKQLAEDLLAYFYTQQLDSPCGSIVFVYHNQAEANDVYTAGRINFDVTDSSGAVNVDPNATNLKHKLTLNIGGFDSNQEYGVTY